jgi:hypothetical protein
MYKTGSSFNGVTTTKQTAQVDFIQHSPRRFEIEEIDVSKKGFFSQGNKFKFQYFSTKKSCRTDFTGSGTKRR